MCSSVYTQRAASATEPGKMMAADGHVADMERDLFAVVAARVDITEDELNQLIDDVK